MVLSQMVVGAWAASYYVDIGAGSDANPGTSISSPWQHCPGDSTASGIAGATPLRAGDTVFFKGGSVYTNTITALWNGNDGNPITYDGNSAGTWGISNAILDGRNALKKNIVAQNRGNLVFRNLNIHRSGGVPMETYGQYSYPTKPLPANPGFALYMSDCTNVVVSDCFFSEIGYWTNALPVSTEVSGVEGSGVFAYSLINLTITNCEFTRMAYPIRVSVGWPATGLMSSNVVITSCRLHDYINWGISISSLAENSLVTGVTVTNCSLYDMWQYSQYAWKGGGGWPHVDPIIMGIQNSYRNVTWSNIVVCNNRFWTDWTNMVGTSQIFLTSMGGDVSIFNNVCINPKMSYGFIYVQDGPFRKLNSSPINFKIYNNSIYSDYTQIALRWTAPSNGDDPLAPPNQIRIKNNSFYLTNGAVYVNPLSISGTVNGPTELDYNLYYSLQTFNQHDLISWRTNDTTPVAYKDLNGLQKDWGYEPHGRFGDPKYLDTSHGLGLLSSRNNLRLQDRSPAIGSGVNLTPINLFGFDSDGAPRPSSGAWDMGAFQYSSGSSAGTSPPAPTGLAVIGPG